MADTKGWDIHCPSSVEAALIVASARLGLAVFAAFIQGESMSLGRDLFPEGDFKKHSVLRMMDLHLLVERDEVTKEHVQSVMDSLGDAYDWAVSQPGFLYQSPEKRATQRAEQEASKVPFHDN